MVKVDYDLVFLRSENARMRLKEISHLLKKSPQRLKHSLQVLEKEGIIAEPYCIFDYSYLGMLLFRVYFKGGYIGEHDKAQIIKELRDNPYVISLYELTGEFDLAVEFAAPNPSKFNKELKKIITLIPTLNDYKILLNVVTHIYPQNYLAQHTDFPVLNEEYVIGGDREIREFNKNETTVMKNLLINPKIRLTELAEVSKMNVKTVTSIMKSLRSNRIIRCFKYTLDTNKLGINKFRLFIKTHNLSVEREKQLLEYVLKTNEITQLTKTVGDWDMEVDMEALDKKRIRSLIIQLREDFKDIIERFNLIEFYKYHKKTYLPMYLFEEEPSITVEK